jgi:radical SAM superfamily enzyme YgiQ (UPF0313 family)
MIDRTKHRVSVLGNDSSLPAAHPLGSKAKVLLTSVFGPYGKDDENGSRALNPMELYHNQVTRTQGPFSLRMFHRSWGLMLIQANIDAPCTVLDFPTLDRLVEELRTHQYDIIGISAIIPNLLKVKKMCELIRQHQPQAKIVIGGHVANALDIGSDVDADFIVRGEGVQWFRHYLGETEQRAVRHPLITSGIGTRNVGISIRERPADVAATVIPSVGCPLGCNFCSTSAMFGGKGQCYHFFRTGDELFDVMRQLESEMGVRSFFMMDENFLLHRRRALRVLELMRQHDKSWSIYVFSSANVLRSYTMEQLVGLGVSWVWMGIEGCNSQYVKLQGIDSRQLVRELQSHGIRVLGSTIIGLENHTPENIDAAIDYAVEHDTDFHQFMLYTPVNGTPFYAQMKADGRLKDPSEYHVSDIHGQYIFNYHHDHIPEGAESEMVIRAFNRDFERNGPSTLRIVRTTLTGWQRYKNHPDQRIRRRFAWEARELGTSFSSVAGAAKLYYRNNPAMYAKISSLLKDLNREFGWKSRIFGSVGARYVLHTIRQEAKRLAAGWTYEPPTFYENNAACDQSNGARLARYVTPQVAPKTREQPTHQDFDKALVYGSAGK